jgi:hypothetical protein
LESAGADATVVADFAADDGFATAGAGSGFNGADVSAAESPIKPKIIAPIAHPTVSSRRRL